MERESPLRPSVAGQVLAHEQQEEVVNTPVQNPVQFPMQSPIRQELVNFVHIEKFTGENFGVWKFQMSIMF
jgi:hypothetical protein